MVQNKHGASKIIDTFETYQCLPCTIRRRMRRRGELLQKNSLNPLVSNPSPRGLLI
jgi:hypothetical protein